MANFFDKARWRLMGVDPQAVEQNQPEIIYTDPNEDYQTAIKSIEEDTIAKGLNSQSSAYSTPIMGSISTNPEYKDKVSTKWGGSNLHGLLKRYSSNTVLQAIINTRANQVSLYSQPVRFSEKGIGFHIRLKDINEEPTQREQGEIKTIENFILNTGFDKDVNRDTFTSFLKKLVRDTYIYDQVNFEKIYDKNGKFIRYEMVDPTTIYYGTDREGNRLNGKNRYVQVIDGKIVAEFSDKEMAMAIRNPRTDIYAAGYGYSELEVTLKTIQAHENTQRFNDRFFSHGGTTRGVLLIKSEQKQSQQALDMFKREWKTSLSGINGSWQIPVVNAEDVKFVNMSPTARDMEFESWLNYLINLMCSVYQIDPGEVNFPNRGGGATGSGGGTSYDGNTGQKAQTSQNKGLLPLLKFIEDTINKYIVSEWGDKYYFQFVGGDIDSEMKKITILAQKAEIGMTMNEVREELGLTGDLPFGDVPLNGIVVQRAGQLIQQENFEYQKSQDRLNNLLNYTGTGENSSTDIGITFQDLQQGLDGNDDAVNGKDTTGNVGKDGQAKDQNNVNTEGTKKQ